MFGRIFIIGKGVLQRDKVILCSFKNYVCAKQRIDEGVEKIIQSGFGGYFWMI